MTRPRGVLFDMGGTLASDVRFDLEAGLAACSGGFSVKRARECWERQLKLRAKALVECQFDCYLRLVGATGSELAFWEAAVTMVAEPGIAACLESLHHAGVPLGVVSNSIFGTATLSAELRRLGLLAPFSFVLSSADYGIRKPDPWLFELAATRLGVPAAETWFIGDSLEYDVAGARASGMTPIWYAPKGADEPVQRLRHWDELRPLVGML